MNAIEQNGVQNPADVELATLAGGLVALNTSMRSMNKMLQFLCDRYVLDHFAYNSVSFADYMEAAFEIPPYSQDTPRERSYWLTLVDGEDLDKAVFEYIRLSHENTAEQ